MSTLAVSCSNFRVATALGYTRTPKVYTEAIVDTGTGPNLVREDILPRYWERYKRSITASSTIIDANGNRLKPESMVPLYVKMGKTTMRTMFVVTKNLSVRCILGCVFLRRQVEAILPRESSLLLHSGEHVKMVEKEKETRGKDDEMLTPNGTPPRENKDRPRTERCLHPIRVARTRTLQPNEQAAVWVTSPATGLCFLTPKTCAERYAGISLANGVADVVPYQPFQAYVFNYGRKPRTLSKGMVLGTIRSHPIGGNRKGTQEEILTVDGPMDWAPFQSIPACTTTKQNKERCLSCLLMQQTREEAQAFEDESHPRKGGDMRQEDPTEGNLEGREAEEPVDWKKKVSEDLDRCNKDGKLRRKVLQVLDKHEAMWNGKLGELRATEHRIELKEGTRPIRQVPYRAGHHSREMIKRQINAMKDAGVIEPAKSEWASPVVMVPKKDGTPRFCVDYRKLNACTIRDSYPIPRMDDCVDSLGNAKFFTTLDCNSGYWQIPVAARDRDKTTFTTHVGTWRFTRMPFGLTNAPATFQRALDILLSGAKWQHCLVYLDDIIIYSVSTEDHLRHLDQVLTTLRSAGVSLKLSKSAFFQRSVEYLGLRIRPGKLEILPQNVEALKKCEFPKTQTEMRSYLGLCNVYRRFVKGFAHIAAPLVKALTKGQPVTLAPPTEEQLEAFEALRKRLLSPPVLCLPHPDKAYTLDVDASILQVGCALLQEQENNILHPVGYWSRALNAAERNYSTSERECLAVVWAVLHLRPYLEGRRFTVRTDHNALQWALVNSNAEGRLARWRIQLAEYDFDIQYRPGIKHQVPDALSRVRTAGGDTSSIEEEIPCFMASPLGSQDGDQEVDEDEMLPEGDWPNYAILPADWAEPIPLEEWISEQSSDGFCKQVRTRMDEDPMSSNTFQVDHQGILVRKAGLDASQQVVVPETLRPRLLTNCHYSATAGHPGGRRMYDTMRRRYYWPTMPVDIYSTVRQCLSCTRNRVAARKHRNEMRLFPPRIPLESVALDILGPLPRTNSGKRFVVVIADRFSKLCRVRALRSITAENLARTFAEDWVFVYGPPTTLLTDNGPQLTAKLFQETCRTLGVKNIYTSTYHPQTNGQVERLKRTLVEMLRHYVADHQRAWDEYLPILAFAYNRCVHRSTRTTPYELVLTRPPPTLGTEDLAEIPISSPGYSRAAFLESLQKTIEKTRGSLLRMQARYKADFDKKVLPMSRSLRTGDLVFLNARHTPLEERLLKRTRNKLDHLTIGPFSVVENHGNTIVINVEGVPERINADRIVPSPALERIEVPRSDDHSSGKPKEPLEKELPRLFRRSPRLANHASAEAPQSHQVPTPSAEDSPEFVIDHLVSRGIDSRGRPWSLVHWYGWPPEENTWEPEGNIPPAIVARFKRTHGDTQEPLRCDAKGNLVLIAELDY